MPVVDHICRCLADTHRSKFAVATGRNLLTVGYYQVQFNKTLTQRVLRSTLHTASKKLPYYFGEISNLFHPNFFVMSKEKLCLLLIKYLEMHQKAHLWLNGLVVSAHGIRTRGPRFDSRVVPLFRWVATLASCLLALPPHSAVSQLQQNVMQKGSFRRLSGYGD